MDMCTAELCEQGFFVVETDIQIPDSQTIEAWFSTACNSEHKSDIFGKYTFVYNGVGNQHAGVLQHEKTGRFQAKIHGIEAWEKLHELKMQCITPLLPSSIYMAKDPVMIGSIQGCMPQAAHFDWNWVNDNQYKKMSKSRTQNPALVPLSAILCFQKGTSLRLWPGSHKLVENRICAAAHEVKYIHREDVSLDPGDIIVFRGDMAHAGDRYDENNLRMFTYLDLPYATRQRNGTKVLNLKNTQCSFYAKVSKGIDPGSSMTRGQKNFERTDIDWMMKSGHHTSLKC